MSQFEIEGETNSRHKKIKQIYDFSNKNIDAFVEKLVEATSTLVTDQNFPEFLDLYSQTIDDACKLKTPKISKRNNVCNPWITDSIINCVNRKHELLKKWKKSVTKNNPKGDEKLYEKFSLCRKHVKKIIKSTKSNFYLNKFDTRRGDIKKTWQLINELRGKGRHNNKPLFVINNEKITNRRVIANEFNKYFISIAEKMNTNSDEINIQESSIPHFTQYLKNPCVSSIFLEECTDGELTQIISELENGKASDIPIKLIKRSSHIISPIYTCYTFQPINEIRCFS